MNNAFRGKLCTAGVTGIFVTIAHLILSLIGLVWIAGGVLLLVSNGFSFQSLQQVASEGFVTSYFTGFTIAAIFLFALGASWTLAFLGFALLSFITSIFAFVGMSGLKGINVINIILGILCVFPVLIFAPVCIPILIESVLFFPVLLVGIILPPMWFYIAFDILFICGIIFASNSINGGSEGLHRRR